MRSSGLLGGRAVSRYFAHKPGRLFVTLNATSFASYVRLELRDRPPDFDVLFASNASRREDCFKGPTKLDGMTINVLNDGAAIMRHLGNFVGVEIDQP